MAQTTKKAGTIMPKRNPKPQKKKSSTAVIFGEKVLSHGYTGLPNILVRGQSRLGITTTQFNIIAQLLSYYIDADRPPFPSKKELATRMGITPQTLRINIKALEDRGYVTREQRITSFGDYGSNTYRLDGLIRKLKELEPDFEKERQERKQAQKLTETPNARLRKNGGADGRTK
ncbi:helix-turn-helix domain-containing protein [Sulfitobacter sp. 1A15333]|uniref:helix-turn-helix domain-containing protein n=1 Tax=unclassified Sulfitobacter TaxID=196795 RepID=UPI0023E19950|nr:MULTISPECIES: helix-turn-helix domain-containing protein [unclassified Sulfitobacter]